MIIVHLSPPSHLSEALGSGYVPDTLGGMYVGTDDVYPHRMYVGTDDV